jgi:hypothetical protein
LEPAKRHHYATKAKQRIATLNQTVEDRLTDLAVQKEIEQRVADLMNQQTTQADIEQRLASIAERRKRDAERAKRNYKYSRRQAYRLNDPVKRIRFLISSAGSRARQAGIPFDNDLDLTPTPICPMLATALDYSVGRGSDGRRNSPSLDRIIPAKGYTKGNVQVISGRANTIKNDATPRELAAIALYSLIQAGEDPVQIMAELWASNGAIQDMLYERYIAG